jgi:hypothetical protein
VEATARSHLRTLLVGQARFTSYPGVPETVKVRLNATG